MLNLVYFALKVYSLIVLRVWTMQQNYKDMVRGKKGRQSFNIDSDILDIRMKRQLGEMILGWGSEGDVEATMVHCRDAVATCSTFEAAVRHTSEVLVLVERGNGFIFGAVVYDNDCSKNRTGGKIPARSAESFLFSLGKPDGYCKDIPRPLKLLSCDPSSANGLRLGTDFMVFCSRPVCMPSKYCVVAPGYALPPGKSLRNGTLCGSPGVACYSPRRTEVFSLVINQME